MGTRGPHGPKGTGRVGQKFIQRAAASGRMDWLIVYYPPEPMKSYEKINRATNETLKRELFSSGD